jgi:hypothetical protein
MSKNTDFYEREIDGFDGPFVNMYLKRFTPGYSKKKYKTLEEVLEVAKENKYCLGITLSRQGDFTLRLGKELKVSDKTNKFKYKEISWKKKEEIKNIFVEGKGKKEEQFEIIKYGNEKYYYNQYTKKGININSKKEYIMRRGKFHLIN